jgi:uncharacterized protein YebE (UPF0316 family)
MTGDFDYFRWILLPLFIFVARVMDVSLGTVRVICISRGLKYLAPLTGFFEILIWLLAIGEIMKHLSDPVCYIAYAAGYATGNYVGILLAEKMSLGFVLIRVIIGKDVSARLVEAFKAEHYGITTLDGQGAEGSVKIIHTIMPRREMDAVIELIKKFVPHAFYTIEEVEVVEKGIIPLKKSVLTMPWLNAFRFAKKGK